MSHMSKALLGNTTMSAKVREKALNMRQIKVAHSIHKVSKQYSFFILIDLLYPSSNDTHLEHIEDVHYNDSSSLTFVKYFLAEMMVQGVISYMCFSLNAKISILHKMQQKPTFNKRHAHTLVVDTLLSRLHQGRRTHK